MDSGRSITNERAEEPVRSGTPGPRREISKTDSDDREARRNTEAEKEENNISSLPPVEKPVCIIVPS